MTSIRGPFKRLGTQICDSKYRVVAQIDPHRLFGGEDVIVTAEKILDWLNSETEEPDGCDGSGDCTPAYLRRQAPRTD